MSIDYRSGGFKPGHFSFIPTYDPEDLVAYELGYKGQMFDGTVQLNASMCLYEYDDVHLQFDTFSFTGVSTSVQNAPSARTIGGELEGLWLVTDNLTVGVNDSFTDAECGEALVEPVTGTPSVVDGKNATAPASTFTVAEPQPADRRPASAAGVEARGRSPSTPPATGVRSACCASSIRATGRRW